MTRRQRNSEHGSSESVILKKRRIQNHSFPPPLPYPWIISRLEEYTGDFIFSTTTPPYTSRRTSCPELDNKEVMNCCYGWLIYGNRSYDISLWNPVTSELIPLPPIESEAWKPQIFNSVDIVLSSSPSKISTTVDDGYLDPNTMILLFDWRSGSIIYCTLEEQRWNRVCYAKEILRKPFSLNGSLYARGHLCDETLHCIHQVKPTHIRMRKYCYLPRVLENYSNYLVESYGELFYIAVSRGGMYSSAIVDIHVFKLNQESLRWHKVNRAQDRVFFLGRKYNISYLATGEIKGGFIYIEEWEYIYIYSFKDHSISISMPHLMWNIPKRCHRPILYVPDLRLFDRQVEKDLDEAGQSGRETIEQANKENNMLGMNEGDSKLFSFPIDLLILITRLLNPVDYINLRAISKTGMSLLPQIQWREPSISLPSAPLSPWLLFSYSDSGIHSFVDSKLGGEYLINIPKSLLNAKILHSKNGWLLMSKASKALFFYNPFTTEIIKLPKPHRDFFISSCIGFSTSPNSPECLVVAIDVAYFAKIYGIRLGEKEWHYYESGILDYHSFVTSQNSPVFYDGAIYVLGRARNLAVFELQREGQMTWNVLHRPKRQLVFDYENFLLECDEELLLVVIGEAEEDNEVFKLNRAQMSWERVKKLESYALYVSRSSSFSTLVKGSGMENRIFLPRLHDNSVVNYSLKTRKYHCFSRQDTEVKYFHIRELLHGSWIEPSWSS